MIYKAIVFLPAIAALIAGLLGRVLGPRPCEIITTSFVGAAAVLLPDELKPTALGGAQVELEIGIGRNGLVQIGHEHVGSVITADKFVDDLARDDIAFVVVAQACFHLMADQGFDLKDFALGG